MKESLMEYMIRPLVLADLPELVQLCAAHAQYEEAEYDPTGKEAALQFAFFQEPPAVYALVVEVAGKLTGYATYMKQYATWDAAYYVYMDCLFLVEEARSQGIGARLVDRIKEEANAMGCTLIQWQTPDFNERAIKFYRRIGASGKTKERFFLAVD